MVNVTDHLVTHGLITSQNDQWTLDAELPDLERAVPQTLHQLIELQLHPLSDAEQQVLEAASVAGVEFSTQAVAAGLTTSITEIEACCHALAERQQFLRPLGESQWPDGTVTAEYAFAHALYQDTLYQRVDPARRIQLHQQIGQRLEAGYGEETAEIVAQLVVHFERSQDNSRAVTYLHQAGEQAVQRYAYQDAIAPLTKALKILHTLPDTPERDERELAVQVTLGIPLLNTKGFAAPEVEQTYGRALKLCRRLGETPQLFKVLEGLHTFYAVRGQLQTAIDLAQQLLRLGQQTQDRFMRIEGHHTMGTMELRRANLDAARSHLEQAVSLYDPDHSLTSIHYSGHDPKVCSQCFLGLTLWFSGFPDQALHHARKAYVFAQQLQHPDSLALAQTHLAWVHMLRGEIEPAQELTEAAVALATQRGLAFWAALGTLFSGWAGTSADSQADGTSQVRQGFDGCQTIGVGMGQYLILLADSHRRAQRPAEGLSALAQATELVQTYGEHYLEAEIHRLRGHLLLQQIEQEAELEQGNGHSHTDRALTEAEQCFQQAVTTAQQQHARSLELKATRSLCRLWQRQGKHRDAALLLSEIYGWFTEGFETAELLKSKALLEELN